MNHRRKWIVPGAIVGVVIVLAVAGVLWWLPSDAQLAAMFKVEAERRLAVKVSIGAAHWSLLPAPFVAITDLRTEQAEPVTIGRLIAWPSVRALLDRKLVLDKLQVDDAVLPRQSLLAFRAAPGATAPAADDAIPLRRLEFHNVTWIPYSKIAVPYDGEVDFDKGWRPRLASVRRPASEPPFTLSLQREADQDRWQASIDVGGGTANGTIELDAEKDGAMRLSGQLEPRNIDIEGAMKTFDRRAPIGGKASGKTTLSARGESMHELVRSLHTRSTLTVASARILRFDFDKALSSLGKEHDGQTALEELTGQIDTHNTEEGMRVVYSRIVARHGRYTARGDATVYHRHVEARGTLDLVDGAVGIPFTLSGPTTKPKVSVPPGFFAGAVVGNAVLPGIGTAIGAKIGGAIGRILKPHSQ